VTVKAGAETKVFDRMRRNRPEYHRRGVEQAQARVPTEGTITAGNAPGLNGGAAAMLVANRSKAESLGLEPVARLVAFGVGAVEPGMFGWARAGCQTGLGSCRLSIGDVDRFEINEAFAAVPLALIVSLESPPTS
jgi:acetyl-CoA C-acetyltransferase